MRRIFRSTAITSPTQYSIEWFTIDGGGGMSTGGGYSMSGTIGPPDAGRMSGGNYTIIVNPPSGSQFYRLFKP